ncbi:CrcB family protein [Streptomyces sp. NE06-03E]|uniref:Fluoride-specific ion channel FluC n=1 Tax=Streptomyces sp. gb1(2016) TaxID=1828321 RepID=A0A652LAW5_9ACTN|nr:MULTISPECIES: CrcB family protein [unclassified Streptomyces]MDX3056216.1 CrcB family protein [Streptomyces sp. NE06-03E]TXS32986.1 CrcB family protein [Streptomyces sp. gb1(2016)]
MDDWLLVLAGGAAGAPVRYLITSLAQARGRPRAHWGTLGANLSAALLLGFLVEAGATGGLGASGQALLSTGFCGALSTWSTFSHEIQSMASARRVLEASGYLVITVTVGLALSFAGAGAADALW